MSSVTSDLCSTLKSKALVLLRPPRLLGTFAQDEKPAAMCFRPTLQMLLCLFPSPPSFAKEGEVSVWRARGEREASSCSAAAVEAAIKHIIMEK